MIVTALYFTVFFFFFLLISLHDLVNVADYLHGQVIRFCLHIAFGIYPDDRLSVRFSQVDPLPVEMYFYPVDCRNRTAVIFFCQLFQDIVDIHFSGKTDFVLRNIIIWITIPEFGTVLAGACHER